MTENLLAFVCSAVFAACLTPAVRRFALHRGFLDHALSARKVHGQPVPRLGGIAIVLGFYGSLLVVAGLGPHGFAVPDLRQTATMLAGSLVIAALGVYDDLRGTGAGQKFAVQFAVASFMYAQGLRIEALSNPFGSAIDLGLLSLPFTLLWFVGITNAFNLIDGLDGLAGGVALIAIATNAIIALGRGETMMVLVSMALAGAVLGFLFYNFNPASIFMGDTGSMFLGFVLATLSLVANQKSSTAVAILIPVLALGLPILDTALALLRRAARGEPVFRADRQHIHHQLLAHGFSHREAVLSLYSLSLFLGLMAIALSRANAVQAAAILGGVGGVVYLLLSNLGYLGLGPGEVAAPASPHGRAEAIRLMAQRVRFCDRPEQVWEIAKAAGQCVGADWVSLAIVTSVAGGETTTRLFAVGEERSRADLLRARFPLRREGAERGALELGWRHADQHVERTDEEAIEVLCAEISLAVARAEATPGVDVGRLTRRRG